MQRFNIVDFFIFLFSFEIKAMDSHRTGRTSDKNRRAVHVGSNETLAVFGLVETFDEAPEPVGELRIAIQLGRQHQSRHDHLGHDFGVRKDEVGHEQGVSAFRLVVVPVVGAQVVAAVSQTHDEIV